MPDLNNNRVRPYWYEVRVSHKGRLLFATSERSIPDTHKLHTVYWALTKRFAKSDGFTITAVRRERTAKIVDVPPPTPKDTDIP